MSTIYLKKDQIIYTSQGNYVVEDYCNLINNDANLLNELCLPAFDLKNRSFYDVKVDMIEFCPGVMDTITVTFGDNYSRPWDIVIDKNQKFYDFTGEKDPYTIIPGNQVVTDNGMVPVKHMVENMNSVDLYKFTLNDDCECVFIEKVLIKTIKEENKKKTKKNKKNDQ